MDTRVAFPIVAALAGACLLPGNGEAQFNRPGQGVRERETRTVVSLTDSATEALWKIGPFRVTPRLGLQDLRYDANARSPTSDEEGDVTATLGAGFDAYLPLGSDSVADFTVLPAYTWWNEFDERNRLVGTYSASYLGLFNRLQVDLGARRLEELDYATSELLQRVPVEQDTVWAAFVVELSPSFELEVSGRGSRFRADEPEPGSTPSGDVLRRLDHDRTTYRAGLAWTPGTKARIGVGMQREVRDFDTANRSNEGDSPYLSVQLTGNRLDVTLGIQANRLAAREGSDFAGFDDPSGSFRIALNPGWRIQYFLYGGRYLSFSLGAGESHFEEHRLGAGLGIALAGTSRLTVFGEQGEARYTPVAGATSRPDEEMTAWGGELAVPLGDRVRLRLGGGRIEYDSPLPGFDREASYFTTGLAATFGRVRVDVGSGL